MQHTTSHILERRQAVNAHNAVLVIIVIYIFVLVNRVSTYNLQDKITYFCIIQKTSKPNDESSYETSNY